ncbi:MAG TPA: hypothetical protein VM450_11975 [Thermomicrobiales bacterium]|nr:hypothetical protein [Thermomicrobiales bacterium]
MPEDARNRFDDDIFTHRVTKDGKVLISWQGRIVTTLAGSRARQLIARLDGADRREVQHLLARATGHFKHGNERESVDVGPTASPRTCRN